VKAFAALLDKLYFTYSHLEKIETLKHFFANTPDPERGYTVAVIAGLINFQFFKRALIVELAAEKVDPYLLDLSYGYVGDLAETIALLWPGQITVVSPLPPLNQIILDVSLLTKNEILTYLHDLLNLCNEVERWALIKLGLGNLRIGVSARFIKIALAEFGRKDVQDIERIWHGLTPPFIELFAWLENKGPIPDVSKSLFFHPVMLSHPIDENELSKIGPELFSVERKFDGIRVQLVSSGIGKKLYTRTGDDISGSFPDVIAAIDKPVVLDGELVIYKNNKILSFNELQQRFNRKNPAKKLIEELPGFVILYDILIDGTEDVRQYSFLERRAILESWFAKHKSANMMLSEILPFNPNHSIHNLREQVIAEKDVAVEGLMIKKKDSPYIAGRPMGHWYKWKRDPLVVDAVLMYAQRGTGKRSSFYSDYTFGLWSGDELLPIGKAYFGFTDEELKQLDHWIRTNTVNRVGPVREVKNELVFEVAFDSVNLSTRHKSGYALRFPRISRIRWDKPGKEADQLTVLSSFLTT